MTWNDDLTQLRDVLATLYPTRESSYRIVDEAGIPRTRVSFSNIAVENWHNILVRADNQGKVINIIRVVRVEYEHDTTLIGLERAFASLSSETYIPSDYGNSSIRSIRDIPPLLPYLADRDDQEKELREILHTYSQSSDHPMIFIVHGDERQCHDMFLRRLQEVTLRKYLGLDETTSVAAYEMHWPTRLHNPSQLANRLCMSLADQLSIHSNYYISASEINQILAAYPGPVLIHTHLLTDDFRHFGRDALISYLRFWNDWPELMPTQQLFVFLFIKYQSPQKQSLIQRLRCVRHKHNHMLMQHLQEASWTEFNRIICRVIPKLENITRSDVEKWARMDETSRFCRGQNVFAEIRDLFENHPPDGISMDPLDQHLIAILRKFAAGEGH